MFGLIVDAKVGGFEEQKQAFRIIHDAIQKFSLDHEIDRKRVKQIILNDIKIEPLERKGLILAIL